MSTPADRAFARPRHLIAKAVAAIVTGGLLLPVAQNVCAADASAASDELSEVTVTGSRITRRDYEANSPLVSVDAAALEQRGGLNVESYLNQLPSYNPAASPNVKSGTGSNSDVQVSAVNTIGIASISLRGFGANRSLVLVDGRRAIPTNSLMVVDVNNIPSSMIKRVEIISGGASATYGADAIGGVSNFLLRKDFRGFEVDTQWGTTQARDGDEMRASAIIGTNIDDGRGSMVLAAEYYDRKASFERNRDFFTDGWMDPTTGGNTASLSGASGYNTATGNQPNVNAVRSILSGRPAGTDVYALPANANYGNSTLFRFNPDQTIYDPIGNNRNSFRFPIDGYRYALQNAYDTSVCVNAATSTCAQQLIQTVKYYANDFYVSSPQTRYSFMGSGKYDITDDLSFNTNVRFAQSKTKSYLGPSTGGGGWGVSIPYNAATDSPVNPALDYTNASVVSAVLANPAAFANPGFIAHGAAGARHPVPLQLAILLNSRAATTAATPRYCLTDSTGCPARLANGAANPNATTDPNFIGQTRTGRDSPWLAETYAANSYVPRSSVNTNEAWQIEAGLNYKLPFADWNAELYYSRGESSSYSVAGGNRSLARLRALMTAADYGRNSNLQSNLTNNPSLVQPGFGSVPVPCTSGFYETLFAGDAPASADCTYAISAQLQSRSQNQQDISELNFQGGLFSLPAGQVRAAFGAQYRRNAAQFNPDILQSTTSITDQVIGLYPTGYLDARMRARDYYAEALVPVLEDTFVKKIELEIGGRYSDYDRTKSTWTYKVNGNIEVNDSLRLRGGYNRATRSPNLGELYLPQQELFGAGGYYGDPCGLLSTAPYGAAGAPINNPLTNQRTALASGQTAAGANSTYLICRAQMGAGAAPFYAAAPPAGTSFNAAGFTYQKGNDQLESEVADTWTAGVVLRSPFENALLNRITATIDWYQIAINKAILPYSQDYARYQCYGTRTVTTDAEALAQAATPECQAVLRDTVAGGPQTVLVSYANLASVRTSGIDFSVDWQGQFEDMGLGVIPGGLGLNIQGTWLDYYRTKQSSFSFDPLIEWKGSIGPNVQGFNAGAYEYRLLTTLSYNLPAVSFNLRWRHLPSVIQVSKAQQNAFAANNARVAAGGAGSLVSYQPSAARPIASYDVFDLSGFWTITDALTLRFGVDNVFDKNPPPSAPTNGFPYDPAKTAAENAAALTAVCGGAPGCAAPAAYGLPSTGEGTTSGGYYDTFGRRFYVGLKARF